jgi:DNA-directed RNA polymerase subunit RPC12/RpoP
VKSGSNYQIAKRQHARHEAARGGKISRRTGRADDPEESSGLDWAKAHLTPSALIPVSVRGLVNLGKSLPEGMVGKVLVMDTGPSVPLPVVKGGGNMSYRCAGCYGILLESIEVGRFPKPTVFVCPKCGTYNCLNV